MSAEVRSAVIDDLNALLALEAHFPSDRLSRRSMRHLIRSATASVRVAFRDELLVADLILLTRRNSRTARIYSLVVHPAHQRQGLAQTLIRDALTQAALRGCNHISLEVAEHNHPAVALYQQLGFVPTAQLPHYYADGSNGLRLARPLRQE